MQKKKLAKKAATLLLAFAFLSFGAITNMTAKKVDAVSVFQNQGATPYGDVNMDSEVDSTDAVLVLRHDSGMVDLTEEQLTMADLNGDNEVDSIDAVIILKYDSGMIDEINPYSQASIVVNSVTIKSGTKSVSVDISILDNPGITSLKFGLTYDSGLTLTGVAFNSDYGIYVTAPEPYTNPQQISLISPLSEIKTSGTFATLTFNVDESVCSGDKLNIGLIFDQDNTFDATFSDVVFKTVNGTIIIS